MLLSIGEPSAGPPIAVFVLSPAATYLTGNVTTVDGEGRTGHLAGVF